MEDIWSELKHVVRTSKSGPRQWVQQWVQSHSQKFLAMSRYQRYRHGSKTFNDRDKTRCPTDNPRAVKISQIYSVHRRCLDSASGQSQSELHSYSITTLDGPETRSLNCWRSSRCRQPSEESCLNQLPALPSPRVLGRSHSHRSKDGQNQSSKPKIAMTMLPVIVMPVNTMILDPTTPTKKMIFLAIVRMTKKATVQIRLATAKQR